MYTILACVLVWMSAAFAGIQDVPIGVIMDSRSDAVRQLLEEMLNDYNSQQISTRRGIRINASWLPAPADIDNTCDLIRAICTRLDSGVVLLMGSSTSRAYNTIQSYSQAVHVPYLLFSETANGRGDGYRYDLSVSPSYVQPVADLVKFFSWHSMFYIFDADDALMELQYFHDLFRKEPPSPVIVDARRLKNITSSHDLLRRIDRFSKPPKRIILNLSSLEAYQTVLNQIVDVGMNRDTYHYILFGPYIDRLDLKSFLYGGVNVTGFRLPIQQSVLRQHYPTAFPLNFDYNGFMNLSTEAALAADSLHLVLQALNGLRKSSDKHLSSQGVQCWGNHSRFWQHGTAIREQLLQTSVTGTTGIVKLDKSGSRSGHQLEVMQLQYRTPLRPVGNWTLDTGVMTDLPKPKLDQDLLDVNRTRLITTILENPFVMEKCEETNRDGSPCTGNARYEGYCVDLLQKVAEMVGFDYEIHIVSDKNYGAKQDDDTWNGMIGELIRGDADIAVAPITITEARERVVDFSKPFMDLGMSIMIREPDKEKGGVFSFKNPLSDGVWIAIIMGFLSVSLVLFLVGRFSPYEWESAAAEATPVRKACDTSYGLSDELAHAPTDGLVMWTRRGSCTSNHQSIVALDDSSDHKHARPAYSLANTVWFSLGALMQQGSDIYPRSISGRIVGSAWWFFTLIIISSYTANLAAFLTIERMEFPIDSADDLARQTEIRYGIIANGSTEEFFKFSNVTVYKKMWNFMSTATPSVFVSSTIAGVKRVRSEKGKYAFLLDSVFNEYHNQRQPCNTIKVGGNLDNKGYGIATRRGSDLRQDINIAVLHLNEIGELLKLYQKWWYDKGECASKSAQESKKNPLTLSNVSGIFHILIGGLILAMMTAFLDFMIKYKLRKKNKKEMRRRKEGRCSSQRPSGSCPRRMSEDNGECKYATLDPIMSRELENHRCRHRDEAL